MTNLQPVPTNSNNLGICLNFVARLTNAIAIVCLLFTFLSLIGRVHWLVDLLSHFRVQYLAALLITCIALGWQRKLLWLMLCLLAAGVQSIFVIPHLVAGSNSATKAMEASHRIMLVNVNTHQGDPKRVQAYVLEMDPDILVLEEINDAWMNALNRLSIPYPYSVVQTRSDNFGIGVFSKFPLENSKIFEAGSDVPSISTRVEFKTKSIHLIATHPLPPIGANNSMRRNQQLASLPDYLSSEEPNILIGDLNTTPWNSYFQRMLSRSELRDSGVGRGWQPTWPSSQLLFRIPIDHMLYSREIQIKDRFVGKHVGSDHFPLIVDFQIAE